MAQAAQSAWSQPPPQETLARAIGRLQPGQRVEVKVGSRGKFDYLGRRFMMVSLQFQRMLPMYGLTATERDVWDTMVGNQKVGGLVLLSQQEIADTLGIARQHVQAAIKKLSGHHFLWMKKRGVYQIHPMIAFYGSAEEQEAAIAEYGDDLPVIELPAMQKRPARRARKPKLKAA